MNEKRKMGAKLAVVALVTGAIVYYYQGAELRTVRDSLLVNLEETQAELVAVAEATGKAQIDDVASSVVQDCKNRSEYEQLLSDLENLSEAELNKIKDLHGDCGSYFPTVRAFYSHRLEQLLDKYESQLSLLADTGLDAEEDYQLADWRSLVTKEVARAELLSRQSELQGRIIDVLVSGDDAQIPELLEEAQTINGSLGVTSVQINNERAELVGS